MNPLFEREVASCTEEMIRWRRHLHQNAELSFQEAQTTAFLEETLHLLGIETLRPTRTGIVGRVFGTKPGKSAVLAIRADIDALPITEENDLPFRSRTPGAMHACGHDGHAAMLLALAKLLSAHRDAFSGEARLIFQHAEELPPGGAIELLRAGALDGADAVLGLHLSTNWDTGVFGIKSGVLTAAVDRFDIELTGRGGHCAFPEQCADPIVAAAELVLALQTIVSRNLPATEPAIVSVCRMEAGTAYNIIPGSARITAAVRSFSRQSRDTIEHAVRRIASGIAATSGTEAQVSYERGYPSIENDAVLSDLAEQTIRARFGDGAAERIGVIMPGEDYAYFLDGRPGFFVELGSRNSAKLCDRPHHNPLYRLDEDALPYGLQYLFDMTRRMLDGTRENLGGGPCV